MRIVLLLLALFAAAALPAQDDRDRTTPVERQWLTDVSPSVMTTLQNDGWRFTDIDVTSTLPSLFSVVMVKNTGSYTKTWTYRTAATPAELSTLVSQGMRIVDLEPYESLLGVVFAAILVANTGADAKAWWWWYDQTSTAVDANIASVNGRLTCFKRYTASGQTRFATVMISNTGADNRGWGYLYGATSAAIDQFVSQNGARIYGIERIGVDSYDVVFIDNPQGFGNWYYYEQQLWAAQELIAQNLARVVDVEVYTTPGFPIAGTRCVVVMLDAANALERTARQAFWAAAPGALGDHGFFLKQVGGPVLAEMRADTPFEPASTIKTLYHVHVMRKVALGQVSLGTAINEPQSCGVPGVNQTLQATLSQMMEASDNMATLAISNAFGITNIDATADDLGMSSTSVNFTIGCSGPSPNNWLTLRDLSTLHEEVADGYLAPNSVDWRPTFYALMPESLAFPTWGTANLDARMNLHSFVIGMSPSALAVFKSKLQIAYKPGGIGWAPSGTPDYYYAEGGWMSVPFRAANGLLAPREYTFGVFNHYFHAQEVSGRNSMCNAELELVWDRVRAAMDSWGDYVPGSITALPGAGCAGTAGVPLQECASIPDLEETVVYSLDDAPANGVAVTMFGFSSTNWSGVPLPVDLAPIGAPGCILRTDPSIMLAGLVSSSGILRTPIVIGTDTALIGAVWFSQFLVLDPPANAFGMTVSNALRTQIGGSF